MIYTRRSALVLGAFATAAALAPAPEARALDMQALAAEAARGGPVVWYESSPEDQADAIIEAFNAVFPDVEIEHIRVTGGNAIAARAVQEVEARGYTADILSSGSDHIWELNARDILLRMDWTELGIDEALFPNDFTVATAAAVYTIVYNTNRVSADEVPTSWEGMLDPKWTDRMGSWVRAAAFAQLGYEIGVDEAREMLQRFVQLRPLLFQSTFPLAQQVAAGEIDIAIGLYHTAQPPLNAGAPIALAPLDPAPMHTIFSSITANAQNMAGAKLFFAWLHSPEGLIAYENATNRGSHLMPGTRTFDLVGGSRPSEWPPELIEEYQVINEEFNGILATVGDAR